MKKTIILIGVLTSTLAGASAQFSGEAHAGYATKYIFRGQDLGDNLFYGGFDGSYSGLFGMKNLSTHAGLCAGKFEDYPVAGMDLDGELDLYGSVSYGFGAFEAEVGYTYYIYDGDRSDSQEGFASLAGYCEELETYFALTYFLDLHDQDNGGYLEATVSRSFGLSEGVSLDVEFLAAYLVEETEFSHLGVTVAMPCQLGEVFTISPYVAATFELSGLDQVSPSKGEDEYIGGVSVSAGF